MKLLSVLFLVAFSCKLSAQMKVTENGIKIYDGTSNIFPSLWLEKKYKTKATAPDSIKVAGDTTAINTAMGNSQTNCLKANSGIFILLASSGFQVSTSLALIPLKMFI